MDEQTLVLIFNEAHLQIGFYTLTVYENLLADLPDSGLDGTVEKYRKIAVEAIQEQREIIMKLKKLRKRALSDGTLRDG